MVKSIKNNQGVIKNEVWFLFGNFLINEIKIKKSDIIENLKGEFIRVLLFVLLDEKESRYNHLKVHVTEQKIRYLVEGIFTTLQENGQNGDISKAVDEFSASQDIKYIDKNNKSYINQKFGECSVEDISLRFNRLLQELLYDNIVTREFILAKMYDIICQHREDEIGFQQKFIEVAKKYCPNDIPEVKAEIQKQEFLGNKLKEYNDEARKIKKEQEEILTEFQHKQLMIRNNPGIEESQNSISLTGSTSSISSFSKQVASTDVARFSIALVTNEGDDVVEGSQDIYDKAIKNLCELVENITLDSVNAALISQKTDDSVKEVTQQDLHSFKNRVKENGLQVTLLTASKTELEILSILLDQDKNINDSQRDLLGTLIDHNVALKIAGEIDSIVISTKIKKSNQPPSCSFEAISTEHNPGQKDISVC